MSNEMRLAVTGIAFLVIFGCGFWLSRTGKPYSTLIFTVHKLVSLGLIIFLGMTIARINQTASLTPVQVLFTVLAAVGFVATLATGGIISAAKTFPTVVLRLHQITPYLTLLSCAASLYLLLFQKGQPIPS